MKIEGLLFDMDGVICDSAKYHYLAWKKLANHLGFDLDIHQNEHLKGLSRRESIDALFKVGDVSFPDEKVEELMTLKNSWYLELIKNMDASDLLPGALDFINNAKKRGFKVALGSSSKNAAAILKYLNIENLFDAVVDGTHVTNSKPHPEVFLLGAEMLGVNPKNSIVFEDATSGVDAAINGNFKCVGIGKKETLHKADIVVNNLGEITLNQLEEFFQKA